MGKYFTSSLQCNETGVEMIWKKKKSSKIDNNHQNHHNDDDHDDDDRIVKDDGPKTFVEHQHMIAARLVGFLCSILDKGSAEFSK